MQLGSLRLDIVRDSFFRLDGGAMFEVVPKTLWKRKFPADAQNRIRLATNCLLVRGPGFTLLVESGLGDKWDARSREMYAIEPSPGGGLEASLRALGVGPGDVDALVLSHLHFDHAGGATRRDGDAVVRAFPNATMYVQARELADARSPHERDRASYHPENWEPWAEAGRLEAVDGEREIRPGVRVIPVPGHNSGMQAVPDRLGRKHGLLLRGRAPDDGRRAAAMAHGVRPLSRRAPREQAAPPCGCRSGRVALRLRARSRRPLGQDRGRARRQTPGARRHRRLNQACRSAE